MDIITDIERYRGFAAGYGQKWNTYVNKDAFNTYVDMFKRFGREKNKNKFFNNEKMQRLLYQNCCIFFLDLKQKLDYAFYWVKTNAFIKKYFQATWDVPNDKMEFTSLLMMGYSCDYRMGLNE
jgi:hypothetical protein